MIDQRGLTLDDLAPYPVPPGRGRWRFTLHSRVYVGGGYGAAGSPWSSTMLATLSGQARGRKLERGWNKAAALTFTVDGRDPVASTIAELQTDVFAWRWDDWQGRDVCAFHGVVDAGEDQLTEESHTITFTAHDYLALLERRRAYATTPYVITATDQDTIAETLVSRWVVNTQTVGGTSFLPGSWLPLYVVRCAPNGGTRGASGQVRDRSYVAGAQILELFDQLATVINGFDYDVLPAPEVPAGLAGPAGPIPTDVDALRVFYPNRGVPRADVALVYGGNVATLTRTVSSADYANRIWATGNNGSSDPNAAPLVSDQYNASAAGTVGGLWMDGLNAPDVSQQATLNEQAQGALALEGQLIPTYTLTLRPASYRWGDPNVGDVVPLVVQSGRLDVEDDLRVMGITWDIGDDGDERVTLDLGRAPTTLGGIFRNTRRQLDALNRK